jgi:hypothetical protein
MPMPRRSTVVASLAAFGVLSAAPARAQSPAVATVDSAIARMGGRAALDSLRTAQYEIMTQWLGLAPDAQPFRDAPSYERQTEWRDYRSRVWRNVRRFAGPAIGWQEITDLVVDTIPARRFPSGMQAAVTVANPALPVQGWAPLNVAYVEERRELFAWAPERVVLALRDAPDLRARPDTTIGGERHAVVNATVDGLPFTAFFRRGTALPTAVRFRADERNDFGLAPWGPMDVEIWYSRWTQNPSMRLLLPRQWDTKRVGRPYKRMTVLGATYNAALPADSLVLPDTVRALYLALGRRAMGDIPIDSARAVAGESVVAFYGSGGPSGAVRVGDGWYFLDGGNLPVNAERAATWLDANAPGGARRAAGAIVTANRPGSIGVWAARGGYRTYASAIGAEPARASIRAAGASPAGVQLVARGQWLRGAGRGTARGDSVWVEPVELVNGSGLLVYVPSQRWAYSGAASAAADLELMAATLRRRGWAVDRVAVAGRLAGMPAPR